MSNIQIDNPIIDYITISDEALRQVQQLLENKKNNCLGIRVSIRTRGCSGLSYVIEYAVKDKNITKFDDLAKFDDILIFIDPKVSMFLIGSEMIYTKTDLEEGFDFVNPNEKARCGCGESFSVS